ncbi:hypothetical protein ACFX13_000965 [Malus domestica]
MSSSTVVTPPNSIGRLKLLRYLDLSYFCLILFSRQPNKHVMSDIPKSGLRRPGSRPRCPEELDNVSGEITEEVKIGNGEHKSYSPPSAEVKDASFNKDQVPSSLLVPPYGIITMPKNPKHPRENGATYVASEPPSNGEDKENINYSPGVDSNHIVSNVGESSTGSAFDSRFSFSGTLHAFEDSDDDDTRSIISSALQFFP